METPKYPCDSASNVSCSESQLDAVSTGAPSGEPADGWVAAHHGKTSPRQRGLSSASNKLSPGTVPSLLLLWFWNSQGLTIAPVISSGYLLAHCLSPSPPLPPKWKSCLPRPTWHLGNGLEQSGSPVGTWCRRGQEAMPPRS